MSTAYAFFFKHAGWSYTHGQETPQQGRARALAEAESLYLKAHRVADVSCEWEDDPDDSSDGDTTPETREGCVIWHGGRVDGVRTHLASLWGIGDADADYRRVVRAELALECADELRAIIAAAEVAA